MSHESDRVPESFDSATGQESGVLVSWQKSWYKGRVSSAFRKQIGSSKRSQSGFSDVRFMCGVACYSGPMLCSLQLEYNNLRVVDWTMLCNSRLGVIIIGMSPQLKGLSEPSENYKCSTTIIGR